MQTRIDVQKCGYCGNIKNAGKPCSHCKKRMREVLESWKKERAG